ncbi:helix-turn-helix domain-containing protein [Dactylosporangium sp. NPDC000244]|uniref:helix-turn-helix transcriptional regulator n=1 Tax=Dactylosporangium sp. NPDC000244 TaxID=3154365 RepID=UPI00332A94E1
MSAPDPLQLLTTAEVAGLMRMSGSWVAQQRKAGRITPQPGLGRSVRYTRAAVAALQASLHQPRQRHLRAVA